MLTIYISAAARMLGVDRNEPTKNTLSTCNKKYPTLSGRTRSTKSELNPKLTEQSIPNILIHHVFFVYSYTRISVYSERVMRIPQRAINTSLSHTQKVTSTVSHHPLFAHSTQYRRVGGRPVKPRSPM